MHKYAATAVATYCLYLGFIYTFAPHLYQERQAAAATLFALGILAIAVRVGFNDR